MNLYRLAADRILKSRYAVALTGAGISVESGIPDFRSPGGLWSKYDPLEFGHIESFRMNPQRVWKMLVEMDQLLLAAHPNQAHFALAELEDRGQLKGIITQNVDSLHQSAGSRNVIEFHGHNRTLSCDVCGTRLPRHAISFSKVPPYCACGYPLRPDFVFFGENIPQTAHEEAMEAAHSCDLMLVIGTSATVAPASLLPSSAKRGGAFILEINPNKTELTYRMSDLHIAEPAGKALPAIVAALDQPEI
jgi:NAD-dependent deacetylase